MTYTIESVDTANASFDDLLDIEEQLADDLHSSINKQRKQRNHKARAVKAYR